jgi:hypothetical protein
MGLVSYFIGLSYMRCPQPCVHLRNWHLHGYPTLADSCIMLTLDSVA